MESQNLLSNENSNVKMNEKEVLRKYKVYFAHEVNVLRKQLKNNQLEPEKHPSYSSEWRKFTAHFYDSLCRNGKNFDLDLKWMKYWERRMMRIYESDVDEKRIELRLNFPISDERAKRIEDEVLIENLESSLPNEVINLISVCKLLSTFSYELDGLVPEVVDLLYEAIEMEKKDRNSCDILLLQDKDNISLLEKVEAKLTSALSNDFKIHHDNLIIKAIKNITKLLHQVEQKILEQTIIENPEGFLKHQINPIRAVEQENIIEKRRVIYSTPRVTLPEQKEIFEIFKEVHASTDLCFASSSGYHLKPPEFWKDLKAQNGNKNTKIIFPNSHYQYEIINDYDIPTVVSDYVPENNSISNDILQQQNSLQANTAMSIEDRTLIEKLLNKDLNEQNNNVIKIDDDSDSEVEFVELKRVESYNLEIPKLNRKRALTNSDESDIDNDFDYKLLKI